ncbi:hypothetical protein [Lentzea sp.]|uniref:hypothetical protein n=1 Tax=Lentzea sp. TaxID=56099 RepID=UPI002B729102|nr:hypothetical protein [Lentzea sp.]HUQ59309.1 hypothetical protein [Lentzea sp.]
MSESWTHDDSPVTDVAGMLRERIEAGHLETWLTSESGRSLAFVTNTERAMVMLLDGEGDPGEHATDPGAEGASDGFVLSNGQDDEYPDADTVPLDKALGIVEHVVGQGVWPTDAHHVSDR